MHHSLSALVASGLILLSSTVSAQSIGSYSKCKTLKSSSARAACEKCLGTNNFYQAGSGTCGMAEGMHASKPAATVKPPPRPTAMPKSGTEYVTIEPATFNIGARTLDPDKDDGKEVFGVSVTLTHRFEMKATEVTQAEWYFITAGLTTSYDKGCGLDCPANAVSWLMALEYLNMLSKKAKLEPCYVIKGKDSVKWPKGYDCTGYRLPTDAEWELAARGGNEEPRYGALDDIAWHYDNAQATAHPVGKKKKNDFGLYDTLGNVWEWVWDVEDFKPYPDDVTDPVIGGLEWEPDGKSRVVRGGSHKETGHYVRVQHRYQYPVDSGGDSFGFRPVRTLPAK